MTQLMPNVIARQIVDQYEVTLSLDIIGELICLAGHFPDNPVVPGVAQVHWAELFAREFLQPSLPERIVFSGLEAIKFQNIIQPEKVIELNLKFNVEKSKLYFTYKDEHQSYSTGRIAYSAT